MSAVLFFVVWMTTVGLASLLVIANWKYIAARISNEISLRRRPLVYIATDARGSHGIVLCKAYRKARRRQWRNREWQGWQNFTGWDNLGPRPTVRPLFVFGPDRAIGNTDDFIWLVSSCRTEPGHFDLSYPEPGVAEYPWRLREAAEVIYGRRRGRKLYQARSNR